MVAAGRNGDWDRGGGASGGLGGLPGTNPAIGRVGRPPRHEPGDRPESSVLNLPSHAVAEQLGPLCVRGTLRLPRKLWARFDWHVLHAGSGATGRGCTTTAGVRRDAGGAVLRRGAPVSRPSRRANRRPAGD